jgi:hypothetical protein
VPVHHFHIKLQRKQPGKYRSASRKQGLMICSCFRCNARDEIRKDENTWTSAAASEALGRDLQDSFLKVRRSEIKHLPYCLTSEWFLPEDCSRMIP